MLITLTEVVERSTVTKLNAQARSGSDSERYTLKEVAINPEYVVCVREDISMGKKMQEGLLPLGLDSRQRFTKVHMDRGHSGIDLVVVGPPDMVEKTLFQKSERKVLHD
jgi:hypothetical protein